MRNTLNSLFCLVLLILGFFTNANAQSADIQVRSTCLNGFLFAIVISSDGSVGITQIFEGGRFLNSPLRPVICNG